MQPKSLDSILSTFDPSKPAPAGELSERECVTIWLPLEYKAAYDRIQKSSRRGFSKKLRELIKAAIDVAEKRSA